MKRNILRGLGLAVVLAVLATGCAVLGGNDTYEVEATFARTYNLFPGSPVRVLGIDVGKVKQVSIEPGEDAVTATLTVNGDVELPADVGALIVPEALLGERYVQLDPPYTGGETLEPGAVIPLDRTQVPYEFDEVLENLNQFVEGLEPSEVGRFMSNLAEVLDDQGEQLGQTIDNAGEAIAVLKDNDEELVALASRLADLNETLGTRDEALGEIIEDWNTVTGSLVGDRQHIDGALTGLVRLTNRLSDLLQTHGEDLTADIAALTRVGRTANRNLDNLSLAILGSAELFRHAERVIDREEHNWLPLVNHFNELGPELAETIANRLVGICLASGLTEEECEQIPLDDLLAGGELCLPGVIPCEDPDTPTVADAIRSVVEDNPDLADAIIRRRQEEGGDGSLEDGLDDLGDSLGGDGSRIRGRNGEVAA